MPGRLDGKTALVTGSSAGIGRAVAIALAREGAAIIATGRREEALRSLSAEIAAAGGEISYFAGDLNDESFIQHLASAGAATDILVNNAGILNYAPLLEITPADCEAMFRTNVLAALRVAQVIGAAMAARRRGHMIVITSGAARQVPKNAVVYSATKHALAAITKGLQLELQPYGIKVSEVSPGMVDTGIRDVITHPDVLAAIRSRSYAPLSVDDVAAAVVFVATASPNCLTELLDVRPQGSV
jgi:3-hydroxy acid dehydrogenase/malonic semialdehyde reductase